MRPPKIDLRDKRQILDEIINLARLYVPEWNVSPNEPDAGYALAEIYSRMAEDTINHLNNMPLKHYIYFLNLIGVKATPGKPAAGHVSVETTTGSPGVYIKRGTQLYGENNNKKIIYETEDDLLAIDNKLSVVYCTNGAQKIVRPYTEEVTNKPFYLFDFNNYENIQKHEIAFMHSYILRTVSPVIITVEIINKENPYTEKETAQKLCHQANWYFNIPDDCEAGVKIIDIIQDNNKIYISAEGEVPESSYAGLSGRWLICSAKKGGQLLDIQFTKICISAKSSGILPDIMIYNDLELDKNNLMPFGDNFSIYDDFYLASSEVFTKKGAVITVDMDLKFINADMPNNYINNWINLKSIMPDTAFETGPAPNIMIERVIWEYWNGNGWSRIFINDNYETLFNDGHDKQVQISFTCPRDFDSVYIGAHQNLWIRARILKISNPFRINGVYVVPVIEHISLSYSYPEVSTPIENIMYSEDLKYNPLDNSGKDEQLLYFGKNRKEPSAYLGFVNEISSGPIKILFHQKGEELRTAPSLKFEYFCNGKWIEITPLDETRCFKNSGIITFMANEPFTKTRIFGNNKYWMRIINTDCLYDSISSSRQLPCIYGVYFNTVKVTQVETMSPEYFGIESNERNKKCQLTGNPIIRADIWVNECGCVSDGEAALLESLGLARKSADLDGITNDLWIKYSEVSDFLNSDEKSRHYKLDRYNGTVKFGNGIKGKIPPLSGNDSIMIEYCIGGGSAGNLNQFGITGFAESVPFISKVTNIESILGGCDKETIQETIQRSTGFIESRNRAVSENDIENIVKSLDKNIAAVKCACHIDISGTPSPGDITVAILPQSFNDSFNNFNTLRNTIKEYLGQVLPVTISFGQKIKVIEARYIELSVGIDAAVGSYNDYQYAYTAIEEKLTAFLNPINGNFNKKGFGIGNMPSKEQIYNHIKTVSSVRYIRNINIYAYRITGTERIEMDFSNIFDNPFAVPISGKHKISVSISDFVAL